MKINLPNLKNYKNAYESAGITWPLRTIEYHTSGLLSHLPPPPDDKTGWPWNEQLDPPVYHSKKSWPKFTIVTPSFNQANFLEQTIRSVLLQNYPNLEFIIIDGGSTDGSVEILEKYSPWLSFWESKPDNGQGHAINKGFSLASGEIYGWVNSDDYYLYQAFEKVALRFSSTDAKFVYGYAYNYDADKKSFELITMLPVWDYFLRLPTLAQPSCFWLKTIHQPLWEDLHCALDYELWLRILKGNKRSLIKDALCVANVHPAAKTSDPEMKIKWQADHFKICAPEAHGDVLDWKLRVLLSKVRGKLDRCTKEIRFLNLEPAASKPATIKPKSQFDHLIFCCLITSLIDPQRGSIWDFTENIYKQLLISLKGNMQGVVLTDTKLPANRYNAIWITITPKNKNPYFARWFAYRDYLRGIDFSNLIWCVDLTDVCVLRNPYLQMHHNVLYVGDENGQFTDNIWLKANHHAKKYNDLYSAKLPLLNAGLIGGNVGLVLEFCQKMCEMSQVENQLTDMAAFNYVAYTYFKDRLVHGPQVNTNFKEFKDNGIAWFMHK